MDDQQKEVSWETLEMERHLNTYEDIYLEAVRQVNRGWKALKDWALDLRLVEQFEIYENNRDPEPIDWRQIAEWLTDEE